MNSLEAKKVTVFEKNKDSTYQPYDGLKKIFIRKGKKGDTYRVTAYSPKLKRDVGRGVKIPDGMNKKERERFLIHEQQVLEKELSTSNVVPPNISFRDYCEEWYFPRYANIWKPSTAKDNERWLKIADPYLGDQKIRDLNHNLLSVKISEMKADETVSTVEHVMKMVKGALSEAVLDEVTDRNYLSNRMIPKNRKKETESLTVDEVQKLYKEIAKVESLYWKAAMSIPLFLGLRADEVVGLHWEDVCLDPGQEFIHVNKGVVYISGQGQVVGPPKSSTSNRHHCICEPLISILKEYQQQSGNYTSGPLFRSQTNPDSYVYSEYITSNLQKISEPIGIHVTTQILRATYSTLSLEPLVKHSKTISENLGHSDLKVTKKHYVG